MLLAAGCWQPTPDHERLITPQDEANTVDTGERRDEKNVDP